MNNNLADKPSGKTPAPGITGADSAGEIASDTKTTLLNVQQLILLAQRELATARKMRMQAEKYLRETEIKANSEAQRLILQTRLTIRKDTEKIMRQAKEEVQKVLADIRVIRITAQEELAAQKKYTDAARLRTFTLSLQKDDTELEDSIDKQPSLKEQSVN
jgi:vacuolar-type H+-ATPase subunit H